MKVNFENKKVVAGLVLSKKAAIMAAPLVATAMWTNTDINQIPDTYSQPQVVVQKIKSSAKGKICPDFELGQDVTNTSEFACNYVFGSKTFE